MPQLALNISPNGPVINVLIGVSEARASALAAAGQPVPGLVGASALVDTGASHTCIDPRIMAELRLTPTGLVEVTAPAATVPSQTAEQFDVSLTIPAGIGDAPLIFPALPVFVSNLHDGAAFDVLLGRDVLAACRLTYNGRVGIFTLTY